MFVYDFHKQHVMQLILNDERKEFKEKEMYKETWRGLRFQGIRFYTKFTSCSQMTNDTHTA